MIANGVFIYGDRNGKNKRTTGQTDYVVIERMLSKYMNNFSMRVPNFNHRVFKRRDFANKIFSNGYDHIRFSVNRSCKNSIADFTYLRRDANGKKLKEKDKNNHEKYGHCSDAFDYFITEALSLEFKRDYLL